MGVCIGSLCVGVCVCVCVCGGGSQCVVGEPVCGWSVCTGVYVLGSLWGVLFVGVSVCRKVCV